MSICDYIGIGAASAVSKQDLCDMTGLSEREVRRRIAAERNKGVPIVSSSHSKGYYLASTEEDYNILQREIMSRATKLMRQYHNIEKCRTMEGQMQI